MLVALLAGAAVLAAAAPGTPAEMAAVYFREVDRRLTVPPAEAQRYAERAEAAFARAAVAPSGAQYLVLVDRDPLVQALLVFWRSADGRYALIGASPVSTGRPGAYDYFETPTGVFEHTLSNPDFRAEGTFNENGIRGYGLQGMRVFDFGWQRVAKSWGDRAVIDMRLQLHATDPDFLEQRLGTRQSKGCIRIPASLNRLLDHHGLLDAEYEAVSREGRKLWVLHEDRDPVADAGRYLVIVDSARKQRPAWSPLPRAMRR
jgi:hypothetical protein